MDASRRTHRRDDLPRSRGTRAAATAAFVLGAGLPVLAVAPPAGAATDPGAPWLGAPLRPVAADPSSPPGGTAGGAGLPERPAPAPVGPLATRVEREAAALEVLTERLVERREALRRLTDTATAADARWATASARYGEIRDRVDSWARNAYVRLAETGSTAPGPGAELLSTQPVGTEEARPLVAGLEDATRDLEASGAAYIWARQEADRAQASVRALETEHTRRAATLTDLRARHRAELEAARVSTDLHNAALSHRYLGDFALTGDGTPAVRRAVQFALAQLGKPYVWGAEGPDTYDCSGLVQAAYAAAGVALPRTARPQYLATVPVPVAAMVPGDLLFFGPDPRNWNSVHHVGIYLGRGLMIHAPTTGDVVRIAPIWWAEFFAATRVLPAGRTAGDAIAIPVSATRPPAARPAGTPARPARPPSATPPRGAPAGPRTPTPPAASPPPPATGTPDPPPGQCPAEPLSLIVDPLRVILGQDSTSTSCPPPTTP